MGILLQILKTFSRNERLIFLAAFLIFIASFVFIAANFLNEKTVLKPISGGKYIEGIVGQPSLINPAITLAESDRDLVKLIFSDLKDLAENWKMSNNGKIWNIRLKEEIFWSDNQPIRSDDLIFTIKIIQDPDSRSPLFSSWRGIVVERISEREIKLTLPEPYAFFENTLEELRPVPKHIFENIPAANFRLSDYNLEPIGSGPFKFSSFEKEHSGFIREYKLVLNENHLGKRPYLDELVFKYYQSEDELIKAFNSGAIDGFGGLNPKNLSEINIAHRLFNFRPLKYYAVFLNQESQPVLEDKNVRLALNYAVDKKALIEKVFSGRAVGVDSPLILGMKGFAPFAEENFSLEKANQILEAGGWQLNDGVREKKTKKETRRLEFDLVVPEISFLVETANLIKENWSKIGVKLNLVVKSPNEINEEIIKTRNYQMLVFGNVFANDAPDLSSFWHSSERYYPGLNLALYENKTADSLIESIRKNLNEKSRNRDLMTLQSLIITEIPAIFLYSPDYLYVAKNSLKGFEEKFIALSSDRFENVENWYLKTARVFR